MKLTHLLAAALLLAGTALSAQNAGFVSVPLSTDSFENTHIASFEKANYQGMDCYRNYIVSLQHTGIATVWKYNGKQGLEKLGGFDLATHNDVNHSNVCSFGVEKFDSKDPMPVIYVSQCHKKPYNGFKDILFVERINPDFQSSSLVQTIHFDDTDQLFGYALQWVVDRKNKCLYGFGNTSAASENMLFYDGVGHKLDDVEFHIPEDSYMKPWQFTSSDGRFEMDFVPVLDRAAKIDAKIILSDQHQVFGRMTGKAVLDDGRVLEIKDLMCFAEDVHNRY